MDSIQNTQEDCVVTVKCSTSKQSTIMINSILKTAIKQAERSNFKHRHGCVVFKGSKIISIGFNEIRHCWKLDKKYKRWVNSLHAEQKAIIFSNCNLKRSSLLVVRINKKGKLVNSKPCNLCIGLIDDVGISNVYHSDNSGEIIELKGE